MIQISYSKIINFKEIKNLIIRSQLKIHLMILIILILTIYSPIKQIKKKMKINRNFGKLIYSPNRIKKLLTKINKINNSNNKIKTKIIFLIIRIIQMILILFNQFNKNLIKSKNKFKYTRMKKLKLNKNLLILLI